MSREDRPFTPPGPEGALELLAKGEVELEGRLPYSSNATFLVTCRLGNDDLLAVYKPRRGERPLWDFPPGLDRREVAAYELCLALGRCFVPETVLRHDAPLGPGSLQRFVEADLDVHYFDLIERPAHRVHLQEIAAFDLLANNADRKAGHFLVGRDGRVFAIDHGLCFHAEPKLRTVAWDFAGDPLPPGLTDALRRLAREVPRTVADLLAPEEAAALSRRAAALLARPRFPAPSQARRPYPWPIV